MNVPILVTGFLLLVASAAVLAWAFPRVPVRRD
jgi:hypothetical protein